MTSKIIRIREYRRQDFDQLWQLDRQCFPADIAYSRFELMYYIRGKGSFTLVAEEVAEEPGSEAVRLAFLIADQGAGARRRLAGTEGDRGHIVTLDVEPAARRRGIATQLMDEAEARFNRSACKVCYLEVAATNEAAIAFYRLRNYQVLSTIPGYYGGKLDALVMAKSLRVAEPIHP